METTSLTLARKAAQIDALLKRPPTATVIRKGQLIYVGGPQNVYYVNSGRVRIYRETGRDVDVHVGFSTEGELFGESSLSGKVPNECAIAATACELLSWRPLDFITMMEETPGLALSYAAVVSKRSSSATARLEQMQYGTSLRLKLVLLDLATQLGKPDRGGVKLPATTHRVLASMVQTSREIITGKLNVLRQFGLIEYDRKMVWVDVPLLESEIGRSIERYVSGRVVVA